MHRPNEETATTLANNLIESNCIISERLTGTLRYLDSDSEEQHRGITMRASAIGLRHSYVPPPRATSQSHKNNGGNGNDGNGDGNRWRDGDNDRGCASAPSRRDMVVHLINFPGHVDFSAEVTSSLLLCDSTILVVNAVKGMCARTHSLMREAFLHRLMPILVVNKVDRLCADLGLNATESYVRTRELIETANAVCAFMLNSSLAAAAASTIGENTTTMTHCTTRGILIRPGGTSYSRRRCTGGDSRS